MRKKILAASVLGKSSDQRAWLDLGKHAVVELTSEDPAHPIENALQIGNSGQWRASNEGTQTIRLSFDEPQRLRRLRLEFSERDCIRTQEFVILASMLGAQQAVEVVRQQWNFSPNGSIEEIEEYEIDLNGVWMLELQLTPDISGGTSLATLDSWKIA